MKINNFEKNLKKILIISNNSLSQTKNNGKTLLSFFSSYPESLLRQIYIENSFPDFDSNISFYRITDKDNINCLFNKQSNCGSVINEKLIKNKEKDNEENNKKRIKKSDTTLLIREYIWNRKKWLNQDLDKWLNDFQPEIIFFYAGDSLFMYNLVDYIIKKHNCNLATYISDDYILYRHTFSLTKQIRRLLVLYKMKNCIKHTDFFFTISPEMKDIYKKKFDKDSYNIMNAPVKKNFNKFIPSRRGVLKLLYCGGLEYGRSKTLIELAEAIQRYNALDYTNKAYLIIHSLDEIKDDIKNRLNIPNCSAFLGGITSNEVKTKIEDADILVHVESFDKKNIVNTKLSISTKIADYLCSNKPILAIGPENISSMKFLSDAAYCITQRKEMEMYLFELLADINMQCELVRKAEKKYEYMIEHYSSNKVISIILNDKNEVSCK